MLVAKLEIRFFPNVIVSNRQVRNWTARLPWESNNYKADEEICTQIHHSFHNITDNVILLFFSKCPKRPLSKISHAKFCMHFASLRQPTCLSYHSLIRLSISALQHKTTCVWLVAGDFQEQPQWSAAAKSGFNLSVRIVRIPSTIVSGFLSHSITLNTRESQ
jgi:hypothetical protein